MVFGTDTYDTSKNDFLKHNLQKQLGPEFLAERKGPGNTKLKYIEGWRLIDHANEILDYNGWSSSIVSQTVDFIDFDNDKYSVGISTIVRVTLRDGSYREDTGYGTMENSRQKGAAFEKAKKESVTDALKRTLRLFGSVLGNCLSSKEYLKKVSRLGTPNPRAMDPNELYRSKEFRNNGSSHHLPAQPNNTNNEHNQKNEQSIVQKQNSGLKIKKDSYDNSDDDDLFMAADLECVTVDYSDQEISGMASSSIIKDIKQESDVIKNTNHVAEHIDPILFTSIKDPILPENFSLASKSLNKFHPPVKPKANAATFKSHGNSNNMVGNQYTSRDGKCDIEDDSSIVNPITNSIKSSAADRVFKSNNTPAFKNRFNPNNDIPAIRQQPKMSPVFGASPVKVGSQLHKSIVFKDSPAPYSSPQFVFVTIDQNVGNKAFNNGNRPPIRNNSRTFVRSASSPHDARCQKNKA